VYRMENKKRQRIHIGLWVSGIIAIFCIVIGGGAWYFSTRWRPILDKQLRELVIASTDSLYHVEYSYLNISMVTGNATIKDFKLIPDTNIYHKLQLAKTAPDNLYDLKVDNVVLENFHPKMLYTDKKLNINTIIIDNPILVITNHRQPYNDAPVTSDRKTLHQLISKVLKEVRVDKINLKDIDFTFINKSNQQVKNTVINNVNVNVSGLLIDSLTEIDPTHYYTRNVDVTIKDYKIATPDSLYYLKFEKFSFSSIERKLYIDTISLKPRYAIAAYYKKTGYAKDRFDIEFQKITINDIDIRRFTRDQKVYAGSMDIAKATIEVYNNNSYPRKSIDRTGKFPHQALQGFAPDLKIDTLNLNNADISYTEFDKNSGKAGKVIFDNTKARIYNLTNDSAALAKNHIMRADITSRVMNSGNLKLNLTFNLADKLGAFSYSGTLGPIDGKVLNNITEPLGMVSVKSASVKKLQFNVKANQNIASGNMQFIYDDLKVQILKRDEESGDLKKQGLLSGLANLFVLNSSNPDHGKFITGTIYHRRLRTQSFFSFLWQSMLTGIKESVGVNQERETRLRKTTAKIGGFFDHLKENAEKHKEAKEERQEKREEKKKEK